MKIILNNELIHKETLKAYLIQIPYKKKYFWYPKSLTRKINESTFKIYFSKNYSKFLLNEKGKKTSELFFLKDIAT